MKNQISFSSFCARNLFVQLISLFSNRISIPSFNSLCSQLSGYNRVGRCSKTRDRLDGIELPREANEPTRDVGVERRDRSWWSRRRIDRDVAGRTANLQIDSRVYTDVHTLNVRFRLAPSRIRVIIVRRTKANRLSSALLSTANVARDRYRWMRRRASQWLAFLHE